jgi:Domain of unknown function (DUF6973)
MKLSNPNPKPTMAKPLATAWPASANLMIMSALILSPTALAAPPTESSATSPQVQAWQAKQRGFRDALIANAHSTESDWQRFQLITFTSYIGSKQITEKHHWTPGQNNAHRHAVWQLQLTLAFDKPTAKAIGDFQEESSTNPIDSAIDQYNNAVARRLAELCESDDQSTSQCLDQIRDLIETKDALFIIETTDPRVQRILDKELLIEDLRVD